jgi:uncharacterized protein YlaI
MDTDLNLNIFVQMNVCPICGKPITAQNRIRAHLLPKQLNPKYNIFTYLHKECEHRINLLYVNQQVKTNAERAKDKARNMIKDFKTKLEIMEKRIDED